jgi:hypothetical protein
MHQLIRAAATVITETTNKPGKTAKNITSVDSWKIRIQRQIRNWRKELSILPESGKRSDNIKISVNGF